MKTIKHRVSSILNSLVIGSSSLTLIPLTSCNSSNAIQLANYESYMSQDLMHDLQQNLGYPIQFPYYTTAEMIPAKFERYYDIAVPCGYELIALLRKGWLTEIDWAKFNVRDMNGNLITNETEALNLFASEEDGYSGIAAMNDKFTTYLRYLYVTNPDDPLIKNIGFKPDVPFNILKYGVPYFAQSFMFAYKGEEITFNKFNTTQTTDSPTWADIFWTVSPTNPNQPAIFKNNKIAMIDDARSFYDVSRMVESATDGSTEITNDPLTGSQDTKERMFQTMSVISNLFASKRGENFLLNTDSQIVSKTLADRKCGINGIMSWSGDTIYAAQGAEEFDAFTSKDLHIIKPSGGSLDEIEFMVINKKNLKNTKKLDAIYDAIKQIALHGCEKDAKEIVKKHEDSYLYWTMTNWNDILYTPLLKNIYKAVTNKDELSDYWKDKQKEEGYDDDTVKELFIEIINGQLANKSKHLFGGSVTNLQNSNIHWGWLETKDRL